MIETGTEAKPIVGGPREDVAKHPSMVRILANQLYTVVASNRPLLDRRLGPRLNHVNQDLDPRRMFRRASIILVNRNIEHPHITIRTLRGLATSCNILCLFNPWACPILRRHNLLTMVIIRLYISPTSTSPCLLTAFSTMHRHILTKATRLKAPLWLGRHTAPRLYIRINLALQPARERHHLSGAHIPPCNIPLRNLRIDPTTIFQTLP